MSYETEGLAEGCGKFVLVCFVVVFVLLGVAFLLGRSC